MPRSIACRPESMTSAENAAKNVIPLPGGPNRRDKHELAFLPAALEIVETPPSPIGRAIGVTIIALFGLALAWASLGEVDIRRRNLRPSSRRWTANARRRRPNAPP